jgi:osmotically-inducible protein OsmY
MAERDRQNPYWNEQHDWRDRLWRREGQQQSWQGRPESQWSPQSGYTSQRTGEWQRDYRSQDQQRGYPNQDSERDYRAQDWQHEQRHYRDQDWQRDFSGRQPIGGEGLQAPYGGGEQSGYAPQSGYDSGWQSRERQSSHGGGEQRRMHRRGPKNYTRSDERIREDVCERLMRSDVDASDVTVNVSGGKVMLEGTVPERRMKHSIEDIAEQCFGVTDIDNNLRVSRQDHTVGWTDRDRSAEADALNRCLRSELSATETYRQALDRDRQEYGTSTDYQRLSEILRDHEDAASRLREAVRRVGGEPSTDSGAWGTWSKMIMGAAKLFGDRAALKSLKEGEESGFVDYERLQRECRPSADLFDLVSELMGRQQRHIRELDSLMAAAERK